MLLPLDFGCHIRHLTIINTVTCEVETLGHRKPRSVVAYMLWFNFILGLNSISIFWGMVMHGNEFKTKENKI